MGVRLGKRLYDLEGIIGEKVGEILQKDGDDRMISHSTRPTLMRKFTDNFMASNKPTRQQSPPWPGQPSSHEPENMTLVVGDAFHVIWKLFSSTPKARIAGTRLVYGISI